MSSSFRGPGSPHGNAGSVDPNHSSDSDTLNGVSELGQNSNEAAPTVTADSGPNDPHGNAPTKSK